MEPELAQELTELELLEPTEPVELAEQVAQEQILRIHNILDLKSNFKKGFANLICKAFFNNRIHLKNSEITDISIKRFYFSVNMKQEDAQKAITFIKNNNYW